MLLVGFIYVALASFVIVPIIGLIAGICDARDNARFERDVLQIR